MEEKDLKKEIKNEVLKSILEDIKNKKLNIEQRTAVYQLLHNEKEICIKEVCENLVEALNKELHDPRRRRNY